MTKKQKQALENLRNRVQEDFGPNPVSIEDIVSVARNKLKYGIPKGSRLLARRIALAITRKWVVLEKNLNVVINIHFQGDK